VWCVHLARRDAQRTPDLLYVQPEPLVPQRTQQQHASAQGVGTKGLSFGPTTAISSIHPSTPLVYASPSLPLPLPLPPSSIHASTHPSI